MNEPGVFVELKQLLLNMLDETRRQVDILAVQLEPLLLDDEQVALRLAKLARRGRHTRIRILVGELRAVMQSGHQLLALSRRLSTSMEIRVLAEHSEWNAETLVICDRSDGLMIKTRDHRWQLLAHQADARREAERFDRLWLAGELSPELRQF